MQRLQAALALANKRNSDLHALVDAQEDEVHACKKGIASQDVLIDAQKADLKKVSAEHEEYRLYLDRQIKKFLDSCGAANANVAVYERIYKMLVQEIHQVDDPNRFESLKPSVRNAAMEEVWSKFRRTQQIYYHSDLASLGLPPQQKKDSYETSQ